MENSRLYDMHIHTKYSPDSASEIRDIFRIAKKRGLDGVAITDHDTMEGALKAHKLSKKYELSVIIGCEYSTDAGDIIGYFLNEDIKTRNIFEVIDRVHQQGGLVSIPHPFDRFRARGSIFYVNKNALNQVKNNIDFVEINGKCFGNFNNRAKKFAEDNNLQLIGGSDSHEATETGKICTKFTGWNITGNSEIDREFFSSPGYKMEIVNSAGFMYPAGIFIRRKFKKYLKI